MGSDLVVTLAPVFDSDLRIDSVLEPLHPETLVPELSVEAFVGLVLPGLAGVDRCRLDAGLAQPLQHSSRYELGTVVGAKIVGAPRTLTHFDRTSITRGERMLPATSIARHSRVNSSITVRHLIFCPFAHASNTKSYAQTWLASLAGSGRGLPVATRLLGLRRGT